MMRDSGCFKRFQMRRTTIVGRIALVMTVCASLLAGCGDGSSSGEGASASTPSPAVRKVQPYTSVNASNLAQAPRSQAAKNTRGWPPVEFEPANLNFGIVPPHTIGKGTAKIWNVGDQPLRIVKSITSCGCTSTENLAGRVIPPGGFIEFATEMEMKTGLGTKKEKVTLFFEGYGGTQVIFFYNAEVARPVRVMPPYVDAVNQGRTGTVEVSSLDNKPFRILRAHGLAPQFVGFDPATDEPRTQYTLKWDMSQFDGQRVPWFWVIETDHPEAPIVDVRVRHDSTRPIPPDGRPWQPKDQRVLIDLVRNGESVEIITKHEYAGNRTPMPQTARVQSLSAILDVELVGIEQKGQLLEFRVRVTPKNAPLGLLYEHISVGSAGYTVPLRIIGRVIE
ncbi:MAG: DUF1573 domain-containing protein [Planctomycetes bacterium]|nr:DUF1573 domain-containing protein [Planctomycetota bacterium]